MIGEQRGDVEGTPRNTEAVAKIAKLWGRQDVNNPP